MMRKGTRRINRYKRNGFTGEGKSSILVSGLWNKEQHVFWYL
jgi:hypothetical protein